MIFFLKKVKAQRDKLATVIKDKPSCINVPLSNRDIVDDLVSK